MKKTIAFVFMLLSFLSFGQDFFHKNYDWTEKPEKFTLTDEEKKLDAVILKYKNTTELIVYNDQALEYRLTHKIIQLNTDLAIEQYNKYYVVNRGALDIKMQKARVIKPDGTIVIQSQKDIKDALDENGKIKYQYFAFEGIEKGSVIEYLDLVLFPADLSGNTIDIQGSELKKNVEFELISPKQLEFATYSLNGAPNFNNDTTQYFHKRLYIQLDKVDALPEESWSAFDANIQKIYYKFNRNTESGKANFYTYNTVVKGIYESMFAAPSKKAAGMIKKFVAKANLDKLTTLEKIRAIENLIKKEIIILDQSFQNSEDLEFILSKKITAENGYFKLLMNCLRTLSIDFELVVTCNRFEDKFPTEYEAYNFLKVYLLYVPEIGEYVSHDITSRVGFIPHQYMYNKGLFIKEVKVGELVTGVGKVREIQGTDAAESVDEIHTKVTFKGDMSETDIQVRRVTTGYKAQPYQSVLDLVNEEQKQEILEEYLSYIEENAKLSNTSFENATSSAFGQQPLVAVGDFSSASFLEKGGKNFLFKLGNLIGPQSELYFTKERVSPVENPYNRTYFRTIELTIPQGYRIKNPEVLAMDVTPDAIATLGFTSTYRIEGDKLYVEVKEWYGNHLYTVQEYKQYEEVINAAADFNKITIILEKL